MAYFEEIQEAYGLVRGGDTLQSSVQKALQYENWQHLPRKITKNVLAHPDYHLLAASGERPVPDGSGLVQNCQIQRNNREVSLACSLYRPRDFDSQLDMIDADDFPQLWRKLEKDRTRGKRFWVTKNHLSLESENDLHDLVRRLGLYQWLRISLPTPVFCLELHSIECVKPNALDAGLAFYFHQTPGQEPGRTRNLETGKPDMEEWLCLAVDSDSIKCVGGCLVRQKVELNMNSYYENNAQRIRE